MNTVGKIDENNIKMLADEAKREKMKQERKAKEGAMWKPGKNVDSKYIRYDRPERKQQ